MCYPTLSITQVSSPKTSATAVRQAPNTPSYPSQDPQVTAEDAKRPQHTTKTPRQATIPRPNIRRRPSESSWFPRNEEAYQAWCRVTIPETIWSPAGAWCTMVNRCRIGAILLLRRLRRGLSRSRRCYCVGHMLGLMLH